LLCIRQVPSDAKYRIVAPGLLLDSSHRKRA
jgi:hypothetical protein